MDNFAAGNYNEKRKHPRVRQNLEIIYRRWENIGDNESECRVSKCVETVDISISGIQILTNEKLKKGELLKLEINLPNEEVPLTTFGVVEWVKENEFKKGYFNTGINFVLIDLDHIYLIQKIINKE